jgi:hypothetical protein
MLERSESDHSIALFIERNEAHTRVQPYMHFPKFWAKGSRQGTDSEGRPRRFECWRWSDDSEAIATASADEAARRLVEKAATGEFPPDFYGYTDRPLREESIREIRTQRGDLSGVITRNSYGCLVLNTERVMFVDIDIPGLEHARRDRPGFFARLFGAKSRDELIEPIIKRAQVFAYSNSSWGWRAYETRAGVRLLATHRLFDAADSTTARVFAEMDADPLYCKLCEVQKSFRARLTPKPWRCDLANPPVRWPYESPEIEEQFNNWEANYLSAAGEHATCRFLRIIGNDAVHPEVQSVIGIHDELSNAEVEMNLA